MPSIVYGESLIHNPITDLLLINLVLPMVRMVSDFQSRAKASDYTKDCKKIHVTPGTDHDS